MSSSFISVTSVTPVTDRPASVTPASSDVTDMTGVTHLSPSDADARARVSFPPPETHGEITGKPVIPVTSRHAIEPLRHRLVLSKVGDLVRVCNKDTGLVLPHYVWPSKVIDKQGGTARRGASKKPLKPALVEFKVAASSYWFAWFQLDPWNEETMKLAPTQPKAKVTDPRLAGVQQASMQDIETATAVSSAATSEAAWDELADQQERRLLEDAFKKADEATVLGHETVQERFARRPLPANWDEWLDRIVALELARLDAGWALDEHDAPRDGDLEALGTRLIERTTERFGQIDAPGGGWSVAPGARIDAAARGWDTLTLRGACRDMIALATRTKYTQGVPS